MIYLIRHGQTDWNRLKKFNGCTDTELNQTGFEQVTLQAKVLKNIKFDVCFCSPRKRARQSSKIIFKGTTVYDERLTEINCGEFEGTKETEESMELFWQAVKSGARGTENFKDFLNKNLDFCDMITKDYKGKNLLIVTHAANARMINYYFSGKPKEYDFRKAVARNGEIITYEN